MLTTPSHAGDFDQQAALAIPGTVRYISGCHDSQTSADVSNVASFELPADVGPGGAGGACTNALLKTLTSDPTRKFAWVTLLDSMRDILKEKGFAQVHRVAGR